MKILLDTQAFIWLINQDARLGSATRNLLLNRQHQVHLSYFSIFEMTIKASLGKLDYNPSLIEDLPDMGIDLLLPDAQSLKQYTIFNPHNKDPFDNALISLSLQHKLTLVTSDTKILTVSHPSLKLHNASV